MTAGGRLGPCEIRALIGAGGIGCGSRTRHESQSDVAFLEASSVVVKSLAAISHTD